MREFLTKWIPVTLDTRQQLHCYKTAQACCDSYFSSQTKPVFTQSVIICLGKNIQKHSPVQCTLILWCKNLLRIQSKHTNYTYIFKCEQYFEILTIIAFLSLKVFIWYGFTCRWVKFIRKPNTTSLSYQLCQNSVSDPWHWSSESLMEGWTPLFQTIFPHLVFCEN